MRSLQARVEKAAQGASTATETTVDWELRGGVYPLLINKTLNQIAYRNLGRALPGYRWSSQDIAQANAIQTSLGFKTTGTDINKLEPLEPTAVMGGGSTDVGDISYVVPTVGFTVTTWPAKTQPHTWATNAASGSNMGTAGTIVAAKVMAATVAELMLNPDVVTAAKAELRQNQGEGFSYQPMFGDREPPLDYTGSLMEVARKSAH